MSDLLTEIGSPIVCPPTHVHKEWIDYNGHMNMAYYHVAFDWGVDHVYDLIGIGAEYVKQGGSCFTREVHVNYIQELTLEDSIHVSFQLLDADSKRLHFFEHMHDGKGELVATSEQLALHVDMNTRRTAPFPDNGISARIEQILEAHRALPRPVEAGRAMGIRRK